MVAQVQTLNGIVSTVIQWANRNDEEFALNIPLYVSLTEQELFIRLSTLGNLVYTTGFLVPNNPILPKPGGWGKTYQFFYIDENNQVVFLDRETTGSAIYTNSDLLATNSPPPRYYSDYGFPYLIVLPTPTVAYPFYFSYYAKINPLSEANQSNWTSINAYDILLWGTMHKACIFINDSNWAAFFKSLYDEGIEGYNKYNKDRLQDATVNPEYS